MDPRHILVVAMFYLNIICLKKRRMKCKFSFESWHLLETKNLTVYTFFFFFGGIKEAVLRYFYAYTHRGINVMLPLFATLFWRTSEAHHQIFPENLILPDSPSLLRNYDPLFH